MKQVRGIIYDEHGNAQWDEAVMKEIDAELKAAGEEARAKMPDGWPDQPMVPRHDVNAALGDPRVTMSGDPNVSGTTFKAYGGKVDADLGNPKPDMIPTQREQEMVSRAIHDTIEQMTQTLTLDKGMAVRMACLKLSAEDSANTSRTPVEAILSQARRYADFVIYGQVEEIEHLDDAPEEGSDG